MAGGKYIYINLTYGTCPNMTRVSLRRKPHLIVSDPGAGSWCFLFSSGNNSLLFLVRGAVFFLSLLPPPLPLFFDGRQRERGHLSREQRKFTSCFVSSILPRFLLIDRAFFAVPSRICVFLGLGLRFSGNQGLDLGAVRWEFRVLACWWWSG